MMSHVLLEPLAALVLIVASVNAVAQTNQVSVNAALDQRVRAELAQFKGKVNLFAKNLDTGAVYELGGDGQVATASTIKIAIMVEAFTRVAQGKAKWTDELVLTKEKKVGGAGILFEFGDGLRLSFRDAVNLMMNETRAGN